MDDLLHPMLRTEKQMQPVIKIEKYSAILHSIFPLSASKGSLNDFLHGKLIIQQFSRYYFFFQ